MVDNEGGNGIKMTNDMLVKESIKARDMAYAPYSGFMVGAALLATDGSLFHGCNIENASFSPTICAERTAFTKAVSEGVRNFSAIAVAGWPKDLPKDTKETPQAFPCGVCRQVMREFCGPDFVILVSQGNNNGYTKHTLNELLPLSFGPDIII